MTTGPGLDLARRYYQEVGRPMLEREFPQLLPHLAIGRVGEGSECLGFDDHFSQDHDFGPGFCLWLEEPLYQTYAPLLNQAYWALPAVFGGFLRPECGPFLTRVGPCSVSAFYARFLGPGELPRTVEDWFALPQEMLCLCTNGAVFSDPLGAFTQARAHLLSYYPEPVRLKKLAAHCALAAQAGQYNYPRCLRRGEAGAALQGLSRFLYHLTAAVFLLNRRYMPFWKWAPKALKQLPRLGGALAPVLEELAADPLRGTGTVERACSLAAEELRRSGLSDETDTFLLRQGASIQSRISHPALAALPLMAWKSGWQL